MNAFQQLILFDEITPNSSVRVALVNEMQYMSVIDVIKIMCKQNQHYSAAIWRRIPDSRMEELRDNIVQYKFKGQGQQKQDVIQFQGALKLLMWLPGESAKTFRSKAAEILTRYYAGDKTLLEEVWKNAQANDPINVAARAALSDADLTECASKRPKLMERFQEDMEVVQGWSATTQQYSANLKEAIGLTREFFELGRDKINLQFSCEKEKLDFQLNHEQAKLGVQLNHDQEKLKVDQERHKMDQEKLKLEQEKLKLEQEKIRVNGEKLRQKQARALEFEKSKLSLVEQARKGELEHKRALKDLENGLGANLRDPKTYTTVLGAFTRHASQFQAFAGKPKRDQLLKKAGIKAAAAYRLEWKREPTRTFESGFEVFTYPIEAEGLVLDALRAASGDIRAGGSQAPIGNFFGSGQDTV